MNKTIKNIFRVAISNCTSIIAGIFIGFLIPKMMPVEDYGLYKTFTLYMTYTGFFSLGIIDGIVLKYGGQEYDELNRFKFRNFFKWYTVVHAIFACILLCISLICEDSDTRFIVIMIALNMWAVNYIGYFQQISQITQRFKEFSFRKVLQNILNILIVLGLYILFVLNNRIIYKYYVFLLVFANIILVFWYLYTYRDIVFGERVPFFESKAEILSLMINGFPLLFANLLSTLILSLDRQFVNFLFDKEVYAVYAFAYNMLSLVTVATSAFSIVLYPTLKRTTELTLKSNYNKLIQLILIAVGLSLALYYPLCWIVNLFLPKYIGSLPVFRIVFPGLLISSAITVVMHNYYKVLGKNIVYFKKSLIVLLISGLANTIAYFLFGNIYSISIASIIVMLFWYLYVENFFVKMFNYDRKKNFLFLIIIILGFYIITSINAELFGTIIYLLFFVLLCICFFYKDFHDIFQIIKG